MEINNNRSVGRIDDTVADERRREIHTGSGPNVCARFTETPEIVPPFVELEIPWE